MNKVLYIFANPKSEENSYSLSIGTSFLEEYKKAHPEDEVVKLDLYNMEIPLIDEDVFSAWGNLGSGLDFSELKENERNKVNQLNQLLEQFINADKYVFVSPLWNFTIPPKMKAYIDSICIAGKTFKYTENGPVGLLKNKSLLHIQSSGGFYSSGPAAEMEMGHRYIKTVAQFLGIENINSIFIEGTNISKEQAESSKNAALEKVKSVIKNF